MRYQRIPLQLAGLIWTLVLLLGGHPVSAASNTWILVDTDDSTLTVMKGDRKWQVFEDVAFGRYGKTYFKKRGDNKTPLGRFTITWLNPDTRYHRFMGLSYPDIDSASRALEDGRIGEQQWQAIRRASEARKTPPQHTPLGGLIGIHGVGKGDSKIHRQYNWTNGCIALTNEQIDQLAKWAKIGTTVEIR